jgi:low temperature requirement protein LtrA
MRVRVRNGIGGTGERMVASGTVDLTRRPEEPARAVFLELFFDLVFVLALTQLAQVLLERLDVTGAFQTLVLLLAFWWVWSVTAWVTDLYDPKRPSIQLLVIATMLGTLMMAAAVPEAFGRWGLIFAGTYVAIHLGRGVFLVIALRGRELQYRTVQVLFWFCLSAVPWVAGAVTHASARGLLWVVAVSIDYLAGVLRYPTPKLGRASVPEWPIVAEHLAERYRQFFIIVLGELVLVTGLALSSAGFAPGQTAALVVSFATTVLLWRIYIYRAGELLPSAIAASRDPDSLARSALIAHLVMVSGVVATAVGDELAIAHPLAHTRPAWIVTILGGPALFLAGRARLEYATFGRVSRDRLVGVLALVVLAPATLLVPPLLASVAGTAVLAGVAGYDTAQRRERQPEPPSPPRIRRRVR